MNSTKSPMKFSIWFLNITILILIGGLVLSLLVLLPGKLALLGVPPISFFVEYLVFIAWTHWSKQRPATTFPLIIVVTLLMSLWASIGLRGLCQIFSGLSNCSKNSIDALTFLSFFFPILIMIFCWFEYKRFHRPS